MIHLISRLGLLFQINASLCCMISCFVYEVYLSKFSKVSALSFIHSLSKYSVQGHRNFCTFPPSLQKIDFFFLISKIVRRF